MANPRPCPRPPTLRLARGLARKASDGLPNLLLARGLARKASDGLPNLRLARGLTREASDDLPIFRLARGLARKASDGEPILHLARGPTSKASDEMPILRLARGRLGNDPSPLPRPISPTERRVQLMRPTIPAISAGRQLDTAERPTRREVASTPYRPLCSVLCPRPAPALHCAT